MIDWEWVVLDDSPDDAHFTFLKSVLTDKKIRLYKRSENSGNIGNVKNEAVSLCRGTYILELDHDDEIVPTLLKTAVNAFEKYPDAGFAYTECINLYENGSNYWYGDFIALGYGAYYNTKYNV
jgi:glycosyltransferase involved in cell wall biosynthesis